ncbi:MAG TPA: hypothetical protein VH186_26280 [Chloroflexia bacterium]|nr:hypothetical protein [Chloroflexia bacterium]
MRIFQGFVSRSARPYWLLFGGAILFRFLIALLFKQPGYTDAYYYSNVADTLWHGQGFREDYIWNYLVKPLPDSVYNNPSNVYWMPLTSVLIYLAYLLTGGPSFLASQLPFILISSILPPLTYYVCQDIFGKYDPRGVRLGWLSALLMIFCSIYAPYFSLPDNFAPFALFSFGFLICSYKALRLAPLEYKRGYRWLALAGVCAGLAYLTRVDGIILLVVPPLTLIIYRFWKRSTGLNWLAVGIMLLAFGLTISPWLLRNLAVTGQVLPGGGTKTLFWREYNDFFSYIKPLDLPYYLNLTDPSPAWGIGPLLLSKAQALLENLWIVGRGAIFLAPLFLLGLFARLEEPAPDLPQTELTPDTLTGQAERRNLRLWQRPEFLPFALYLVLLYLAMSLAFTFPSTRGSVFHSSGGLLPFIYIISFVGLDSFIGWLGKLSRPKAAEARRRSYSRLIVLAFVIVAAGMGFSLRADWNKDYDQLKAVDSWLAANNASNALLMVPDAPAYHYVSGKPCLSITSDPLPVNLELARRYGVTYFLLQPDHAPASLNSLFEHKSAPGYRLVTTIGDAQLYKLEY